MIVMTRVSNHKRAKRLVTETGRLKYSNSRASSSGLNHFLMLPFSHISTSHLTHPTVQLIWERVWLFFDYYSDHRPRPRHRCRFYNKIKIIQAADQTFLNFSFSSLTCIRSRFHFLTRCHWLMVVLLIHRDTHKQFTQQFTQQSYFYFNQNQPIDV